MKMPNNKGFTLAEVLITLAIIGIVATLTIPALVANYQKIVYVTQLKKFYAEFQEGAKLYYTSKDCDNLKCTNAFAGITSMCSIWAPQCPHLDDFVTKSFKTAKNNGYSTTMHASYRIADPMAQYMPDYFFNEQQYSFLTADNFLVGIETDTSEACALLGDICATVYVDVNGYNGPNIDGRDVYKFYLTNEGNLISEGSKQYQTLDAATYEGLDPAMVSMFTSGDYWRNMNSYCGLPDNTNFKKDDGISGTGCAARIMENGWKMDY